MKLKWLLFFSILCFAYNSIEAQTKIAPQIADQYILDNAEKWGLKDTDIQEYRITDQYASKHNGVTHIYLQQMYQGIPVHDAYINLNITKKDRVLYAGRPSFIDKIQDKVNTTQAKLEPAAAVIKAAKSLGFTSPELSILKRQNTGNKLIFEKSNFARNEIPVELVYQKMEDGSLKLAWDMSIDVNDSHDYWSLRIDAVSGEVLDQDNWTIACRFEEGQYARHEDDCSHTSTQRSQKRNLTPNFFSPFMKGVGAQYRVYDAPTESPLYGDHNLITEPHFPEASPFGWHDTDGIEGPEYTYTRGNNVDAFLDKDDNFSPDQAQPDGGLELIFDFPHKTAEEPDSSLDVDQVNLFYANNYVHDVSYLFGFDEAAGNFQENNFGRGGVGGDYVIARALAGAEALDSNNAQFTPLPEGQNGYMDMFIWKSGPGPDENLEIIQPSDLAGVYEARRANGWGGSINNITIESKIILARDGVGNRTDACQDITNTDEVTGNIAMIDRGICEFGLKALKVQNAGAVAAIICNVPGVNGGTGEELVSMAAGDDGNAVNIPALFMKSSDCNRIKIALEDGDVNVNIKRPEEIDGPNAVSASFDNGIIYHEYGHGVSTRLVGGPSNSGSLRNDEQMGEGWSDFFTLALTTKLGDNGSDRRGIGNYVLRAQPDGRGIRRFHYTTDMNINPQTFNDIVGTNDLCQNPPCAHPLGEIWADVLWDMYWAFVEEYGYDADWRNTNSGNFKAIQLVIDGMKFMNPSPTFTEARDAIFAADDANYNGENACLIWQVFARRGLGVMADGGLPTSRDDGVEDFTAPPTCVKELKITKTANEILKPGNELDVTIWVANHKGDVVHGVIVTDEIPEGFTYIEGSSSIAVTQQGNTLIFELGTMANLDEIEFSYSLGSSADRGSESFFLDEFEGGGISMYADINTGIDLFNYIDFDSHSPDFSWFIQNVEAENDQVLVMADSWTVIGENPAMRFWTKYDTELGFDGGFVELSKDGFEWEILKDEFIQGRYSGPISYSTLAVPALEGFSGSTGGEWTPSFIDLSAYKGQTVIFRFRFVSDLMAVGEGDNPGWFIDDLEFLDLDKTSAEACVTSDENDMACATTLTLFDAKDATATEEEKLNYFSMDLFPNPAGDFVQVSLAATEITDAILSITSMDGKVIKQKPIRIETRTKTKTIETADLPTGFYILQLTSGEYVMSRKLVIR